MANNELVNATGGYSTNIYEELMINFVNTLLMINKNDPNNIIENFLGSSRLNNSISLTKDYSNTTATKIKINYTDNTNKIQNINWSLVDNYYQTDMLIYVGKQIENIQIISEDENTIYQTIEGNFTTGKFYSIKQNVSIE